MLDLLALYPSSGSASTLERVSYKRSGLGKKGGDATRHRGYMLSEIAMPQPVPFQSNALTVRLGSTLGWRSAALQAVEEMHSRQPRRRYGISEPAACSWLSRISGREPMTSSRFQ